MVQQTRLNQSRPRDEWHSNEGLHEVLEIMLPGIGNLEGGQLLFSRLLAVDTNQRQSNIATTPGRRLFPLMHSTWHFVQSSDQGFKVILKCLIWPECRVDPRHCSFQSSEVVHHTGNA